MLVNSAEAFLIISKVKVKDGSLQATAHRVTPSLFDADIRPLRMCLQTSEGLLPLPEPSRTRNGELQNEFACPENSRYLKIYTNIPND